MPSPHKSPESIIDISIIVPAKNEEKRLPQYLEQLITYCQKKTRIYEIIIVDDGSSDQTSDVAETYQKCFADLKVVRLNENRGKGYAVKAGMFQALGAIVLFLDADGSTAPDEIEKNLHYFENGFDVVIGSRVLGDDEKLVEAKLYRKFIGKVFNFFVHVFLFKKIHDTQCGFKMFRGDVAKSIFPRVNLDGFGFDLEVLFLAHKMGYKIKEVPIRWEHRDGSKINLVNDSLRMFVNILQVRNWHFTPINMHRKFISVEELEYMHQLEQYHWWFQSKNALIQHLLIQLNRKFNDILDAGCGTGLNLSYLKDYGRCIGCDIVPQALRFCQQRGIPALVRCNLEAVPFQEKQFDLITSLDVIEHVDNPEKVLQEFHRLLKIKGIAIIMVPAFKFLWSQHDDVLCHLRRYEKSELLRLCETCGFKVERAGYFFCASFFAVLPIRMIRRIFVKRGESKSDTTTLPPKFLNQFLKWIFKLEILIAAKYPLPFGTSLFAVISKNSQYN